jgi:hypothetical protein
VNGARNEPADGDEQYRPDGLTRYVDRERERQREKEQHEQRVQRERSDVRQHVPARGAAIALHARAFASAGADAARCEREATS